jgi:epsilon-lactone hydrolase
MTASATGAPSPIEAAIDRVKRVYGAWCRDTPVAQMRADWDRLFRSGTIAAETQPVVIGGVGALWVTAPKADPTRIVVYFHGGGYKLGSVRSHLDLMVRISLAAHCRVLGFDYRLAPEHQFPAPVHDAVTVYEGLVGEGVAARRIAFAGDSAGGGLLAATILALRERNLHLPVAAVMLSAWTDLTADSDSYVNRAAADPIHQRSMILGTARSYLGDAGDPRDPLASPLFGDLRGFPPVLLQVGDRETVLDDSKRFAEKARAAGVEVELEVYDNMIHVFQQFAESVPEAQQAIDSIGRFLIEEWFR